MQIKHTDFMALLMYVVFFIALMLLVV